MELNLPWTVEKGPNFVWGVRDKFGQPVCAFPDKELAEYIVNLINKQETFENHDV
jgi:hypothetical protein